MTDRSDQDALIQALRVYVETILQTQFTVEHELEGGNIPSFLAQRYLLLMGHVLGRTCVIMAARKESDDTPAAIAKHRDLLTKFFPQAIIIFAATRLSTHNRHRLISHHVPFIVPGNQMFLPDLAIDLREHFRGDRDQSSEKMTPAAQVLAIALLLGRMTEFTASEAAAQYHYSVMSMSRAVDELEALELVSVEHIGKFRPVRSLHEPQQLWARIRPLLRSPVRKRRRVRRLPAEFNIPLAGDSALSLRTDLAEPRIETRALAASHWKSFAAQFDLDRPASWEEPEIELETWSYDPLLLGDHTMVDPISLWLSIPDSADDRVQAAKDTVLREAGL